MTIRVNEGRHLTKRRKRTPAPLGLSRAEWDIVQAICHGCDARIALAERFGLSPRTIDTHTRNIGVKLGTTKRLGIVLRVLHDDAARRLCWPGLKIEEVSE